MGPIIEQVSNDLKDKIEVIKIGFDENKSLAKYLKIENFPSLFIYKNGKQVWRGDGVMQKEELEAIIKKY
jgi:thioredoxin 1